MWNKIKSLFGKNADTHSSQAELSEETISDPISEGATPPEEDTQGNKASAHVKTGYALADAVASIVAELGLDSLNTGRGINALADFGAFKDNRASNSIVKVLYSEGAIHEVLALAPTTNHPNEISRIASKVIASHGLQENKVLSVLWQLAVGAEIVPLTTGLTALEGILKSDSNASQKPELISDTDSNNGYQSGLGGECGTDIVLDSYILPSVDIIRTEDNPDISIDFTEEGKKRIEWVFTSQGIPLTDISVNVGPRVSLYELGVDAKKVGRISRLEKELLAGLGVNGSRILNPIPGKFAVGVEIPNNTENLSTLYDVFNNEAFNKTNAILPIALGINPIGETVVKDLTAMPHLLIGGEMQQGKTSLLRQIVTSLLFKKTPDEVKFTIIDTCSLDLQELKNLPVAFMAQLADDVATSDVYDTDKSNEVLTAISMETTLRKELFQKAGVNSIADYNAKFKAKELSPSEGHRFLPYIIVIVDEFTGLMRNGQKAFDNMVSSILPLASKTGVHFIFTTKHTSTDSLTQAVRANFTKRNAFRIALPNESRLLIGSNDATRLLPNGDMLLYEDGLLTRIQAAECDSQDIMPVLNAVAQNKTLPTPYILPESCDFFAKPVAELLDPLFEEVARLIVQTGVAATSSIQRRYTIGYNRAGKIMDQLEAKGIVGPAVGGKPRTVLVDEIELEKVLKCLLL